MLQRDGKPVSCISNDGMDFSVLHTPTIVQDDLQNYFKLEGKKIQVLDSMVQILKRKNYGTF